MLPVNEQEKLKHTWAYHLCVNLAIVATILMAGAGFVLFRDWRANISHATLDSEVLTSLRTELDKQPDNRPLQDQLRLYDQQLRDVYFAQQETARRAGLFLLICGGVLIVSLKYVVQANKKVPMPQGMHDPVIYQKSASRYGYGAVAIAGVALLTVAIVTGRLDSGRFSQTKVVLPPVNTQAPDPTNPEVAAQNTGSGPPTVPHPEPVQPMPTDSAPAWPVPEQFKQNWYRFRGYGGSGVYAGSDAPTVWNGASGQNILWKLKTDLPGRNSPILWGNLLFFTGATEEKRMVYAVDADKGDYLWQTEVVIADQPQSENPEVMEDTGLAAPTAATDGIRVYAIFANGDVAAVDMAGKQLWAWNLGVPQSAYGYAASLELYQGRLLIQYDQGGEEDGLSKMLALDTATGKTIWEKSRPVGNSWSSPIIANTGGKDQLITIANPWVIAYQPLTGEEIWKKNCLAGDVAPSPVAWDNLIYAISPYESVKAIKTDGQGELTDDQIAWEGTDNIPDTCSPITNGELFLLLYGRDLYCYDARDGKVLWDHGFKADFTASPVIAGGLIYVTDNKGVTSLLKAGRSFELVGTAELGEKIFASPAFRPGRIYFRSEENIIAIGEK